MNRRAEGGRKLPEIVLRQLELSENRGERCKKIKTGPVEGSWECHVVRKEDMTPSAWTRRRGGQSVAMAKATLEFKGSDFPVGPVAETLSS